MEKRDMLGDEIQSSGFPPHPEHDDDRWNGGNGKDDSPYPISDAPC